jgi:hypothetical protein
LPGLLLRIVTMSRLVGLDIGITNQQCSVRVPVGLLVELMYDMGQGGARDTQGYQARTSEEVP